MEVRSIETIVRVLNDAGVQYLVVGGVAVNAHGFVRLTRDIDLVLRLESQNVLRGLTALFQIGYRLAVPGRVEDFANPQIREQWRREKNMIVLKLWSDRHQRTPVDIFVYEPFDFMAEWKRACPMEISPGLMAPMLSVEALIQMKREAGRPQDQIDVEELQRIR